MESPSGFNKVFHDNNGYPSFTSILDVKNTLSYIKRGNQLPPRRVKALLYKDLELILGKMSTTLIAVRDSAVLSLGFAAALRRSEICDLKFADFEIIESIDKAKAFIHIRRSKTDQGGLGYKIAIMDGRKIKPIKRLMTWLELSGVNGGYLFRSMSRGGKVNDNPMHHSDISRLVKFYADSIGLDSTDYSGHSLRSGFITSAAIHGARLDKIMEISRHKNINIVMDYIRDNNVFDDHAGQRFL